MSSTILSRNSTAKASIHYDSIQMLRAVAAIIVTFYHISDNIIQTFHTTIFYNWFSIGYAGVDLFFVISGFIIAHTSLRYMDKPAQLLPYLQKRFYRIYPIYWAIVLPLMLVVVALLIWKPSLIVTPYPFSVSNVIQTLTLWPQHFSIDAVTWTLSHEIYFYILFSLLILSRQFVWFLAALVLATVWNTYDLLSNDIITGTEPIRFFLLSPVNLEFAMGVCIYFLHNRYRIKYAWILIIIGFVAGILMAPPEGWNLNRVWALGIPAFLIVWGAVESDRAHAYRVPNLLVHLGDASYILYLIHFPIVVLGNKLVKLAGVQSIWTIGTIDVALVLMICWLSWQIHVWLEKPIIAWAKRRA